MPRYEQHGRMLLKNFTEPRQTPQMAKASTVMCEN
jgi:hypothetical protein